MHPSGEKNSLGYYLPSTNTTSSTYIYNTHRTHRQLVLPQKINTLSHISISIPSSTQYPDKGSSEDFNPFDFFRSHSTDFDSYFDSEKSYLSLLHSQTPTTTTTLSPAPLQQHQPKPILLKDKVTLNLSLSVHNHNDHDDDSEVLTTCGNSAGNNKTFLTKIQNNNYKEHLLTLAVHPNPTKSTTCLNKCRKKDTFSSELTNTTTNSYKKYSGSFNKLNCTREQAEIPRQCMCAPCGHKMMNDHEGEEKEFWNRDSRSNVKSRSGSSPGDEPESVGSSGTNCSLHASDNSEDSPGSHIIAAEQNEQQQEGNRGSSDSSSFLFIGPVGKKRRHYRERQRSGGHESPTSPPSGLPSTIQNDSDTLPDRYHNSERSFMLDIKENPATVSRGSRNIFRNRQEGQEKSTLPTTNCITSTPTPVIRSVPSRRPDEQPLNLSLPMISENPQSIPRSPNQRTNERVRVSVISLAPRERVDEQRDPNFLTDSCPSELSGNSNRSSNERRTNSPVPSTSRGYYSISSESAPCTNTGSPSTFQGLLAARGMTPSNEGGGPSNQKKKLTCLDCGKEFSQLRNYRYHRSRHEGTQQFACTCPICHKTFNDKGYLSSHLKIHRNAKEYECEWCHKSFNQRVAYNMHIRIHTGHKPHQCPLCEKAFSRKMLLRQHLRTHTGERPYKCLICGKAFADRSNMLLHQRLHSGERPYKCDICQKSFSKNHHLKTHLNHHAGIKPYKCEKCNASFSQSSNMKTHFRKCSGTPSTTSTVTSGSFEPTAIQGTSSRVSNMTIPRGLQRLNLRESTQEDQQFNQPSRRFLQTQQEQLPESIPYHQQLLLNEVNTMNLSSIQNSSSTLSSPLHSPPLPLPSNHALSATGQVLPPPTLNFNLGSMDLTSPSRESRSRRLSAGIPLLPLGNPSPTSLAAGHPFIPLATLESAGLNGTSSNPGSLPASAFIPPPSSLLLMSPRQHSTINDLNSMDFNHFQSFNQSTTHPRGSSSSRSRFSHTNPNPQQQAHQIDAVYSESRDHHLHSPQRIGIPLISPNRQQISPRHLQLPDYYELVLPGLAVSRPIPQSSQRSPVHHELLAQPPIRPHGFHRLHQQRTVADTNDSYTNQQGLLTLSRASTSAQNISPSHEQYEESTFFDGVQQPEQHSWRQRENEDVKYNLRGGSQFRHPNPDK